MSVSAETAAWLDALYGKCTADDGNLVFITPDKKQIHTVGKLGSGAALVDAATSVHGESNLYLKINPLDVDAMRERSKRERKGRYIVGKASEVKTIVSFHLDVDAGKSDKYLSRDDAIDRLNKMPHKPSLIVNSDGSEGGFHVTWILKQPHRIKDDDDRQRISEATYRWQQRLNKLADGKLDSTADICRVLRVVGMPRSNGNLVSCHDYWPDRLYTLDDLTIPPSKEEIERQVKQEVRAWADEKLGPVDPSDLPINDYIEAAGITPEMLLEQAGYQCLRGKEWLRPNSDTKARTLKIATKHDRPGINVFSGGDPIFKCAKRDGSVGKFYSVESMFVLLRHGGNWKAAAAWCHE